jgi:hypothetical protein
MFLSTFTGNQEMFAKNTNDILVSLNIVLERIEIPEHSGLYMYHLRRHKITAFSFLTVRVFIRV